MLNLSQDILLRISFYSYIKLVIDYLAETVMQSNSTVALKRIKKKKGEVLVAEERLTDLINLLYKLILVKQLVEKKLEAKI